MRPSAVVVLLAAGLAGCHASPADRLSDALEGVLSWVATARTVADSWMTGHVPLRYTRATLRAALESLERERASLASEPRTAADDRIQKALPVIEGVEVAVARAWAAVGRADPDEVRVQQQALNGLEKRLRALGARETPP